MSAVRLVVFIVSVYLCYSSEIAETLISLDTTLRELLLSPQPEKTDELIKSIITYSENMETLRKLTDAKNKSIESSAKKILDYKETEPFFFQFFDLANTESDYNLTVKQANTIEKYVSKTYDDWKQFLAAHHLKENDNTTFIEDSNVTSISYLRI